MPQEPSSSRRRTLAWALVFATTALILVVVGMWRMFAHFPGYDDEGYILFSLRNYLEHGGLYARVYSQYGPAFYAIHDGLHRLTGWEINHEFARWSTLILWFGTAVVSGGLAWRLGWSAGAAWLSGVTVFLFLHQFSEEAFHPGAMVVFLLPALLWSLLELEQRNRLVAAAMLAGAGTAILGLLKVNVGGLLAAALMVWVLLSRAGRWRVVLAVVAGLGVAIGLMHGLLDQSWVRIFLLVFVSGLIGLGVVSRPGKSGGRMEFAGYFAGAMVGAGVVLGVVAARGTSLAALWDGVILGPLRHAGNYSYAVDWRPGTTILALASLAALTLRQYWWRSGRSDRAQTLLVGLRLLLLGLILAVVALLEVHRVIGVLFSYVIPWLWVWAVPLTQSEPTDRSVRLRMLTVCVLLFQVLHAYPVGGIQICWGVFLVFPLLAAVLPETGRWLQERRLRWVWLVQVLPVLVVAGKLGWVAHDYHASYFNKVAVSLPGVGGLRLSEREALAHHVLVLNSALHADRLFSLPGMFSYNLWSDVPAPTLRNTTLWYSLLTREEQLAIIEALERSRRPALVVDAALVQILQTSGTPPTGPLHRYLLTHFQPAFSHQGLGFWVRQNRSILPAGTMRSVPGDAGALQLFLVGLDEPVASAVWRNPDEPAAPQVRFGPDNSRVSVQPVNLDATPRAVALAATWPWRSEGPTGIIIRGPVPPDYGPGSATVLELLASDGRTIAKVLRVD